MANAQALESTSIPLERVYKPIADTRGTANEFIVYATSPGSVAGEGDWKYSAFTEALLQEIRRPGLEIRQVFHNVREQVIKITNGQQIPSINASTVQKFYFLPEHANTGESPHIPPDLVVERWFQGVRAAQPLISR